MPQLLPDTFLNNTTQLYLPQVRAKSMLLYGMVLLAVVGAAIAAFFVRIDVSFAAAGVVRSKAEKTEIHSPVNGRVMNVWVHENQPVRVGDTLLTLAPDLLDEKLRQVLFQQAQYGQLVTDLTFLTNLDQNISKAWGNTSFRTSLYAQQYNQLLAQLEENEVRSHKVAKELKADTYLHSEKVLATREPDDKQAEYDQL